MRKGFLLLHLLILPLLMASNAWSQENSDYLKSLEGEATGLILDKKTRSTSISSPSKTIDAAVTSGWSGAGSGAIQDLLPGLSIEQFEQVLKLNYMGSYLFYKRLDSGKKDEVFSFYQGNPDSAKVRDKILQLSKK